MDSIEERAWRKWLLVGNNDGKIGAEKRAHAALLALFHLIAFWREIPPGVHLLGLFQYLGLAELDADPATLTIPLFYVQLWHMISTVAYSMDFVRSKE
jgi:hypothetical protein